MGLDNITAVLQKAQFMMSLLESGFPLSDRLFDPNVWMKIVNQFTMDPVVPEFPVR